MSQAQAHSYQAPLHFNNSSNSSASSPSRNPTQARSYRQPTHSSKQSSSPTAVLHAYHPPWPVYAMDWSNTGQDHFCTLAIGSFNTTPTSDGTFLINHVQVVALNTPVQEDSIKSLSLAYNNSQSSAIASSNGLLPVDMLATKILWSPGLIQGHEYLGIAGEGLQLWRKRPSTTPGNIHFDRLPKFVSTRSLGSGSSPVISPSSAPLSVNAASISIAPVTSFDWSLPDPRLVVTSSYDTTCTMWNIETCSIKTQLIAHDREVYDVACSPNSPDQFVSVGADGSLRLFDVRSLDHSTILYETPDGRPLLRVGWNRHDSNYLTCFALDSSHVVIVDVRSASLPLAQLNAGHNRVQCARWAPHVSNQLLTSDAQHLRLWDLARSTTEPEWGNQIATMVQQIIWPVSAPDWLALGAPEVIQVFQI